MISYLFHSHKVLNPLFIEKFNFKNIEQIPSLKSILISSCSNQILNQQSSLFHLLLVLELLTQQNSTLIRAKQSIAMFKLRKDTAVGGKVTLSNLYDFILKLNLLILPRIPQFKGFSLSSKNAVDLGIQDLHLFPEIENKADKLKTNFGLTLTILINSINLEHTKFLLNGLQIPFKYKMIK